MVSTKTLNGVLRVIIRLSLDAKSISGLAKINLIETEYSLKVLISNGYVLKSKSKGIHEGKKFHYVYFKASESAIEILNNGGFTKQLSMKEKSKTSVKNKLSIKDSNVNGQINQGSFLEKNEAIILKQTKVPNENEKQQSAITKSMGKWFWLFVIPLVIGVVLIAIQFKWFK